MASLLHTLLHRRANVSAAYEHEQAGFRRQVADAVVAPGSASARSALRYRQCRLCGHTARDIRRSARTLSGV
jgi:hypothetical protein